MSEWRPEGLVNPWDVICDQDRDGLRRNPIPRDLPALARLHSCERAAFNAGADALQAALKDDLNGNVEHCDAGTWIETVACDEKGEPDLAGTWVFIPDEKG